jgi:hypothetical protein
MEHAIAQFFQNLFTLRRFDDIGWMIMRVLTVATAVAISYRLLPRRTR